MKLIPAEVVSWDGKDLKIKIPGYTDGGSKPIKAAGIVYPFGDRPDYTGYRILPGDAIWILFNGDDFDSPIALGFRDKNTGRDKNTRAFTHENFKVEADNTINLKTSSTTIKSPTQTLIGDVTIKGSLTVTRDIKASGTIHGSSVTDDDGDGGA